MDQATFFCDISLEYFDILRNIREAFHTKERRVIFVFATIEII